MSSTAGILTLCFVLSAKLCTIAAFPARPCKMKEMLNLLEYELKELNTTLKVNHVRHSAELLHPLLIEPSLPVHRRSETAACGLLYMREALKLIREHQSALSHDTTLQTHFHNMINRLAEHIWPCAHRVLAKCQHKTQPTFPESHFQAKKWTRNFLDSSVNFLKQLNDFLA